MSRRVAQMPAAYKLLLTCQAGAWTSSLPRDKTSRMSSRPILRCFLDARSLGDSGTPQSFNGLQGVGSFKDRHRRVDWGKHDPQPKQGGRQFVGLCPFHEDHNPSLTVSPERQSYKCWSCGEGGAASRS